jgi:hypothetical protein
MESSIHGMRRTSFALTLCCLAAAFTLRAADLSISEFMASNTRTFADEDGFFPDWIEIRNHTDAPIDLLNWSLTDAAGNLTKWRFPATNIGARAYMVIAADGKDRRVPGAPLHTSFNLSAGGEYLALVRPDGTIATQFSPQYPAQALDVSYGFGTLTSNSVLIASNAQVRFQIPSSSADGLIWTTNGFNDSTWTAGTNGIGYGSTNAVVADYGSVVLATAPVGYWRLNENAGATSSPNLGSGGGNVSYSGVALGTAGPRPPAFAGFEENNNAPTFSGPSYATANSSLLSGRSAFTMAGWVYTTSTPTNRTGLFGQNDAVEFGWSSTGTLQCWTPGGGSANATWTLPNNMWVHVLAVGDGSTIRVFTNGVAAITGGSTTANYGSSAFSFNIGGNGIFDNIGNNFSGLIDEVATWNRALSLTEITNLYHGGLTGSGTPLGSLLKTDVGPVMSNVNASAYVRIPFTISDPTNIALLSLKMRYDDGFVAYVNGLEAFRANAPATLAYNSAATNTHSFSGLEEYRFGTNGLMAGSNVLAIHALNVSAGDSDFFLSAELAASLITADSPVPVYFTGPTPGQPNFGGVASPGPAIVETSHSPNVPLPDQSLVITARVSQAFFAVSNVTMFYRAMFGAETQVAMTNSGNGIWTATIPGGAATNGQMIRWYFRATDVQGNTTRWPLFTDPANTAEYLGTIVEPNVASKLDVIHFFAPANILSPGPTSTQSGADSQGGARVSVFFDGEFYDNVHMELRGNSTANFNKKSHRVEFNREHLFRHNQPGPRIRKTSFVADWPDPTYMRQGLSYWLCDVFGAPAPFYQAVRLQLNGQFYQLANHNDLHGEELLSRLGFDPNGALYNAAGQVTPGKASTGGFDKKTRTWELGDADYLNLANRIAEGLPLATRGTNFFDLFDVPEMLNYLVVARWAHENDDVWANLSLYNDNDGDGLWRIIPFDMNLSWGAIFAEGNATLYTGVQATNDAHKAHPLYGGANILAQSGPSGAFNRVYDVVFQNPVTRQMFLRRLRTLLDTWIKPPGTPTNSTFIEQKVLAQRDLIAEEANRDRAWWGWPNVGGQNNFAPGIDITNGVNQLLQQFFHARRQHFYVKHSATNTALTVGIGANNSAGIPTAQPDEAVVNIASFDYNPASGLQGHEFIQLTNPNPFALDISGWELDGGVEFTFKPGTVIPGNNSLYVVGDYKTFKTRTVFPRTGQGLFIVGSYQGQLSARGESIVLRNGRRVVSTNSYPGSPTLAQQYLRITEIMYAPGPTNAGTVYPREDYEYIELKNIGPVGMSLLGIHFTNGISYTFTASSPVTSLTPGQTVVLVKNIAAYNSRYPSATIAGIYSGNLDNGGERIQLHDAIGEEILDFSYNNSWYPITDGLGFSLVIVNENAPFNTWDEKSSWRASGSVNGSPGTVDPVPGTFAPVVVNEVLANSTLPAVDFIELWNTSTNTANIGNWFISDDFFTPKKYRITAGTTIAPGSFITFTEAQFNQNPQLPASFAFSSGGDEAYLFAADASGNLLGYYHGFSFGPSDDGVSFGRHVTSDGKQHFVAESAVTQNTNNAGPRVGPIVISEIMYHPPDIDGADNDQHEFIELLNISSTNVPLYDVAAITNRWKLKDAVDYLFPTNTVIPPGGRLLVVGFDPTDSAALASFQAAYGLAPNISIVGPFKGKLDNSADNVEIARPQPVTTNGFEYVLIDKVDYEDEAPWPAADGFGPSIQRLVAANFGNDPTNWIAAIANPNSGSQPGTPPSITQHPGDLVVMAGQPIGLIVQATGPNLRYQWLIDGDNISGATNSSFNIVSANTADSGVYRVAVFNEAGSVLSSNANVSVLRPIYIAAQPVSITTTQGLNVTFTVSAFGNGQIVYQWRHDGQPIQGANGPSYSITNVQLYEHAGYYDVVAQDIISSVVSAQAKLLPVVRITVTNAPTPVTVLAGGTAMFRVVAGPVHPLLPMTNAWAMIGSVGTYTNTTESVFYIMNCTNNGSVRLRVSNSGGQTNFQTGITVTVLADADRDGMADAWEVAYGFATNNTADGFVDTDGDGMINRNEYAAGTNPTNAASVLRLSMSPANPALLEFTAQSNISYTIQESTNLGSGAWLQFSNVSAVSGDPRQIPFVAKTNNARFYRVVTPQAP